ncbi:MAG: ATPase domain-containing protein [Promethearchaeati archaeon SRVP18_Atabeyarchaeia-1]
MVKLEDRLKRVVPKSVVLLEVPVSENPMKIVADFLRYRQDDKGIYVSSNRSTKDLVEKLRVYGFDLRESLETEKTYVIDLVSKSVGSSEVKGSLNVASPSELSATQMAFEKAVELLNCKRDDSWLLIDSLSTLLVYNSSGALLHFLHFLVGRLRVLGFDGAIFAVEGSVEGNVLSTVRQFCDEVIRL